MINLPALINDLKALEATATPGEWTVLPKGHPKCIVAKKYLLAECFANGKDGPKTSANAELIAASRNALPTLISAIEELAEQAKKNWEVIHDEYCGGQCHPFCIDAKRVLTKYGFETKRDK